MEYISLHPRSNVSYSDEVSALIWIWSVCQRMEKALVAYIPVWGKKKFQSTWNTLVSTHVAMCPIQMKSVPWFETDLCVREWKKPWLPTSQYGVNENFSQHGIH